MACRKLCRQILVSVPRRQRSTAAATAPVCPFHFGEKKKEQRCGKLKPYSSIPSPGGLPCVGSIVAIVRYGGAAKIHEFCDMRHRQLGPIFKETLGAVTAVCLADQDFISTVYNAEGPNPAHLVPEAWAIYNEIKNIKRGLFFMDGEKWRERRKVLNYSLLSQQEVAKYGPAFTEVVVDVINRWNTLTSWNTNGIIPNLETELYNWSIETLGTIVFGRRLRCVTSAEQKSEMHKFVGSVQQIFAQSAKLSIFPPRLAYWLRLPMWTRFFEAADTALSMAREYTETRIAEIQAEKEANKDKEFHGVLADLLAQKDVTHDEIVNIVADLILAAADTTSHATQWALYSLAKNPQCQEKLFEQINKVVPRGQIVTDEHLDKIPYALWIIRETLRLYPIASFLTRILPNDIAIGGYHIPAGKLLIMSQYTIGRNPKLFENPESFIPERWMRKSTGEHQNLSKGCMPFGAGSRSCIGRRIAEMKMRLLITNAVQQFRLRSENDVNIALRMITTPDKPILVRLEKRQ